MSGRFSSSRSLIGSVDKGNLVRLTLDDGAEGSRFFVRNTAGELQPGATVSDAPARSPTFSPRR